MFLKDIFLRFPQNATNKLFYLLHFGNIGALNRRLELEVCICVARRVNEIGINMSMQTLKERLSMHSYEYF